MIFEDIVKNGYEPYINYDKSIDYTYGSLRSRDEQVERIGKKYQKIYLYSSCCSRNGCDVCGMLRR